MIFILFFSKYQWLIFVFFASVSKCSHCWNVIYWNTVWYENVTSNY